MLATTQLIINNVLEEVMSRREQKETAIPSEVVIPSEARDLIQNPVDVVMLFDADVAFPLKEEMVS